MVVVSCSHGRHLGSLIAGKLRSSHSYLHVDKFPDNELRIRFDCKLKNQNVVLVQSFYGSISDCIIEVVFAAKTARELGAKKVALAAPYFPYLRQDKRFNKGEAISSSIIASVIDNCFDSVVIIDPHLHRKNRLENIFKIKAKKLTANSLMAEYIKKRIQNPIIIGPDEESYKWARNVAEIIGAESRILKKKRHSAYHVEVKFNKKIDLKSKNAVIVDDIISTGNTILETAKVLKKSKTKNIYCVCVHGIFANEALNKLKKAGINVASTNTIPNEVAKIDVSGLIAENLKNNHL